MKRSLAVLTLVLSCLCAASAQIIIIKQDGNKTITCTHSGLFSSLNDCGVRSDWYSYVFVGSISTITPVEKDEQELQIIPGEIFSGKPATPLTVLTSQAACLPKLAVGDRWLFFLRSIEDKPIVLDYGGNDSRPVADAEKQIETLRHLQNIGDFGILRGRVLRGEFVGGKVVHGARVIAQRESDNFQSAAITDADGRYEFQPLPPGHYTITVDSIGSHQPDDSNTDIAAGTCWEVTLYRARHAQISGHVHHSDGSLMADVDVMLIDADGSGYDMTQTDERGYFTFDGLRPKKYVVAINLPSAPPWKHESCGGACVPPPASLYYNGGAERSHALVIKLATDEKRQDVDFVAPPQ
jgi:carboxypeptidase family protein